MRVFSQEVQHEGLKTNSEAAASLARKILDRDLLHRAYAFRGRFIATPNGYDAKEMSATQNENWLRIVKSLETLESRYELGEEIYELACRCSKVMSSSFPKDHDLARIETGLSEIGPEHIIVDLPESKTEGIRLLARYPNGALRVPEFSFNPQKWAEAYDLQKRTSVSTRSATTTSPGARIRLLSRCGSRRSARHASGMAIGVPAVPDGHGYASSNIDFQKNMLYFLTWR